MLNGTNHVNKAIIQLRKKLKQSNDQEEVRRNDALEVIDIASAQFKANLLKGKIKIGVPEYERLQKLGLLLSEKPTEIIENRDTSEDLDNETLQNVLESEEFETIKEQLFASMNELNEEGKRK
ncbi:hypothetical protein F373_gp117 [Bacillus phage SP-10]|uniref:hypothetical protein n=1 Tax=Bacillus phage SP10 TaxID=941058 RepID=UPI0002198B49|nr:hypothetical protein F373_gp117 [Bacillus phage SP-10]BAK52929.1 hypothetical protein [Bacillus phage SP-10]